MELHGVPKRVAEMRRTNNLSRERHLALKNGTEEFRRIAKEVESKSDFGWTSGMGNDNYYSANGLAFETYERAITHTAKRLNIS